jgi:uncharacterized membrane protein YfhO
MKKKNVQKPAPKSYQKPAEKPIPKKAQTKEFPLETLLKQHGLAITFSLLSLLILIIFKDFIIGSSYYLFKDIGSDTLNGAYPNFTLASDYFRKEGFPLWSFSQGMGENIMWPTLMDPFFAIVFIVGTQNIASAIIWMELLKLVVTAIIVYRFLRLWELSFPVTTIGTLLYCFSGFMIVGGSWYQFSTEACYLAFLLLAFEQLYRKNSWYLFPLAVALLPIFQPFNLYLYGMFLVIWFLFRHFSSDDHTWKKLITMTLKMAGFSLLGIIMSTFFLLNNVEVLLDSPRVSGHSSFFSKLMSQSVFFLESPMYYTTSVMRLFGNDLIGNGTDFKGFGNYLEAPMFYIGLLPLLLMPQVFLYGPNRKRIVSAIFLLIFMIPLIFPFFRYAFWLFSGDYFRGFSFFVAFVFLFYSIKVMQELGRGKKINLFLLGATFVGLLILLYYPYQYSDQIINNDMRSVVRLFLFLYTALLTAGYFFKNKTIIQVMLVVTVCAEVVYINYNTVNDRKVLSRTEMHQKTGYNDYSVEAIDWINTHDKPFFRINKDFMSSPAMHASLNNAKVQGYFGTSSYHSFNQKYYIHFLEEMNLIKKGKEEESRWANGLTSYPLLLNIASNKYHLSLSPNPTTLFLTLGYDSIARFGNVRVLKNKHFLPLGFTYDQYIPMTSFLKLSEVKKQIILQKAFVAEEPLDPLVRRLKPANLRDTALNYTYTDYFKDVDARKKDTLTVSLFSQKRITGTIDLKTPKMLFFSIPFDRGWNALIDNKQVKPSLCNIGFMGFMLDPGRHTVDLYYRPPYFIASLWVTILFFLLYLVWIALDLFKKYRLNK